MTTISPPNALPYVHAWEANLSRTWLGEHIEHLCSTCTVFRWGGHTCVWVITTQQWYVWVNTIVCSGEHNCMFGWSQVVFGWAECGRSLCGRTQPKVRALWASIVRIRVRIMETWFVLWRHFLAQPAYQFLVMVIKLRRTQLWLYSSG